MLSDAIGYYFGTRMLLNFVGAGLSECRWIKPQIYFSLRIFIFRFVVLHVGMSAQVPAELANL